MPDSIKPRLILFDANSNGGRLLYKSKYNGHFRNNGAYSEFYKTTGELTEIRNDVRIATMLYAEFIDNLGLNFTFLAKKKIGEHELELVYRRLFNNNIKSKYLDYAIKMGKFKMDDESILRAADLFADCKAVQSQIFPSDPIKNFYYFNTYFERYTYEPDANFKDAMLPLLNPQIQGSAFREDEKTSLLLRLLTNDFPHAGAMGSITGSITRKGTTMVYLWRYADEAGVVADGPDLAFGSQEEAETWLGETWPDLLERGIAAVSLFNDRQAVYGPMALAEQG